MRTMLASVGGAPAPVVRAILESSPAAIVFFASEDTKSLLDSQILPALEKPGVPPPPHALVVTKNHQDVGECVKTLFLGVPGALRSLGIDSPWPDLIAFTGGTKAISAAVVWASSHFPCRLLYVGAVSKEARSKAGVGVVMDGLEQVLVSENPWDKLAFLEIAQAMRLFNQSLFLPAADSLALTARKISEPALSSCVALLGQLVLAFASWDSFERRAAFRLFNASAFKLLDASADLELRDIKRFAEDSIECFSSANLAGIESGVPSFPMAVDLLSNSLRRLSGATCADDAVARCCSALELASHSKLRDVLSKDSSNCADASLIPPAIKDGGAASAEVLASLADAVAQGGPPLPAGLLAKFSLLAKLGDPMGLRFLEREVEFKRCLALRDDSLLGHGSASLSKADFGNFFSLALFLLDVDAAALPSFPVFAVSGA